MNQKYSHKKVMVVSTELINEKGYISFVDVFIKLGYLDVKDYELCGIRKFLILTKQLKSI